MKPNEKASEIIKDCLGIVENCGSPYSEKHTKDCALMVVNQILKNDCGFNAYDGVSGNDIWLDRQYWEEVKILINEQ